MSRVWKTLAVLATVGMLLVGCNEAPKEEPQAQPKIAPPVIAEAGVLRVGVDLTYPPYAGVDDSRTAGIDIDVADALAAELGLTVETVQVETTGVAEALAEGEIDVMMSVPITKSSMTGISLAGSYITDGPAFFTSVETTGSVAETITIEAIGRRKVGAQEGSRSFWVLQDFLGEEAVTGYPTVRAGMTALESGEIEILAADALVAAYIARDFDTVRYSGQLEPAVQIGVAVKQDATQLEEAVRGALDALAAGGVLDTIRMKWVEDLPELETTPAEVG